MADDFDYDDDALSVLVPLDVTNTGGVLSSVTAAGVALAEDTNPAWASGTTYAAGARVYLLSTHRVYESVQAGNLGKDPSLPANQYNASGVATWWIDIGPTNKYAMFDGLITSQTATASPLVITLTPGSFNGFALFGIDADSFSVTVKDAPGGNVIYSEPTTPLEGSMPPDYYEYFFDLRFKPLRQLIRSNLEPYGSSEITLTLNKGSGQVKLGMFAIGDLRPMGIPQRDAKVEPQDFSYFKQDAFGNSTVKKRANATGMSISCVMGIDEAGTVLDTVKEVLGTPVVVVGSTKTMYEWLTVFGLISGSMTPNPYPYVTLSITVKGFI